LIVRRIKVMQTQVNILGVEEKTVFDWDKLENKLRLS
jgi:hypothetical protein